MSTANASDEGRAIQAGRGRQASTPSAMPAEGWKDIRWRVSGTGFNQDRISSIAAGTTFYLLVPPSPAFAAFVSLYGFVADPTTIAEHIAFLGGFPAVRRAGHNKQPVEGACRSEH